jgi:CubicO group peptidase (beta-lactamase class C family)
MTALTRRRFLDLGSRGVAGLGAARLLAPSPRAAAAEGAGTATSALPATDATAPITAIDAISAIDAFVERHLEEWGAPGLTLGIANRDGVIAARGYGLRDVKTRTPVVPEDLFQIGSITKSFIALCLLQLQQERKVDLDRPVREYLPWLRIESAYAPITVHHLLTHSSGLPNPLALPPVPLWTGHAPGAHFHYCNLGYHILGLLLTTLDGRPLREIVRSRIFAPLGMSASEPVISHALRPRLAPSYMPLYDDRPFARRGALTEAPYLAMDDAAGCIASTPRDMAVYMQMLLNRGRGARGPVVSPESFARFAAPAIPAPSFGPGASYGYGIAVAPADGRLILRHTGGMVSFSSAMQLDMDAGLGVFASVNARLGGYRPNAVCAYALAVLRAAQAGEPLPPLPEPDEPFRVPNAADYAGTYTAPDGRTLVVAAAGERLELRDRTGRGVALERLAPDAFLAQHPDFVLDPLVFEREGGALVQVSHGADWYAGTRYKGPRTFDVPAEWRAYAGHYRNENPWEGSARVDLRQGRLWIGGTPLVPLSPGLFRIGEEEHAPDRVRFETLTGGADSRALHAIFSGTEYLRVET